MAKRKKVPPGFMDLELDPPNGWIVEARQSFKKTIQFYADHGTPTEQLLASHIHNLLIEIDNMQQEWMESDE